jgi:radical SAM superfamily enzyme YgiQ (UPF0313 family)
MKILLVYPESPATYWSMRHLMHFIGRKATLPPLGLLTIASMLPEDCDVRLVDENVARLTDVDVAWADVVFTSSMIVQKAAHERVVRRCNRLGKPVVAGGPYPTSSHAEIQGVAHFVLGEVEEVLPRFIADLRAGTAERVYRAPEKRPELALTPPPRFDLLRRGVYVAMAVQYSRGCPHTCEFCDVIELFGRRPRVKSPEQVLVELDRLYAWGFRGSLFIVDDNFIGNRPEVMQLLPRLAAWQRERDYPFQLFTETTVRLADDEPLLDAMMAAGFDSVFLGIETPVTESLQEAGKTQNTKVDLLAAVKHLQHKGLEVTAGFIVGFDGDPHDVFDRQLDFIARAGIPQAMVGMLTALPRTRLHTRLAAEGRLVNASGGNNTHDLSLSYVPRMGADTLVAGYKRLLGELYDPDRYFERCLTMLAELGPRPHLPRTLKAYQVRAVVLSLLLQTFSRYGVSYVRYLVRAMLTNPGSFTEAVTMAVKGHHYFAMTESLVPECIPARRARKRAARERAIGEIWRVVGAVGTELGTAARSALSPAPLSR